MWFAERLGSKEIYSLVENQSYACIGVLGEKNILERRSIDLSEQASVTQLFQLTNYQNPLPRPDLLGEQSVEFESDDRVIKNRFSEHKIP